MAKRKKSVTIYFDDKQYEELQEAYAEHIKSGYIPIQDFLRLCVLFGKDELLSLPKEE